MTFKVGFHSDSSFIDSYSPTTVLCCPLRLYNEMKVSVGQRELLMMYSHDWTKGNVSPMGLIAGLVPWLRKICFWILIKIDFFFMCFFFVCFKKQKKKEKGQGRKTFILIIRYPLFFSKMILLVACTLTLISK